MTNLNNEVELTIPMLPNMEITATKTANAISEFMKFDEDKSAEVSLAIIEACINSFEHSQSPDGKVFITFKIKSDELVIEIRDNGKGFDPTTLKVPKIEDKFKEKRKRGWGMQLMKELMDEVTLTTDDTGTLLVMSKKK